MMRPTSTYRHCAALISTSAIAAFSGSAISWKVSYIFRGDFTNVVVLTDVKREMLSMTLNYRCSVGASNCRVLRLLQGSASR